ncbi:non-specific serine/threonine protein kinase [Metarhizium robertsii ARSEF 23]|uniref:Non-specific serine/threonine protein kinase n=1 Tax=Metarhizium robertsii (strain ARSEF 23 / ATCC MYA-3075) TaxID=655844 RepID=A0A0B2X8P3_METRA|nr:non-specific serine/threonine protein kinase [Metarhizium robertsii ARSEF 23]KHO11248.1 non-specific serine/threonine protein kinase [Metarhizium robertsii ARSEF 23]
MGGKETNFAFQHKARWDNDYKEITLFDKSHDGGALEIAHPGGIRLRVDQLFMTVKVIIEYKNPTHVPAVSQSPM